MGKENEEFKRQNCSSNSNSNNNNISNAKPFSNDNSNSNNINSENPTKKLSDAEEEVDAGGEDTARIRSPIQPSLPDLGEANHFVVNSNSIDSPSSCKTRNASAAQTPTSAVTSTTKNDASVVLENCSIEGHCAHGKLNDLVADVVCTNGRENSISSTSSGYGDCSNIRAMAISSSLSGYNDHGGFICKKTGETAHMQTPQAQNSSFSFKHFLSSSSSTVTAPSTTVTSLDPLVASSSGTHSTTAASATVTSPISTATAGFSLFSSQPVPIAADATSSTGAAAATTSTSTTAASYSLQTSTGARPKVPQSASVTTTSISSLTSGNSIHDKSLGFGNQCSSGDSAGHNAASGGFLGSKMKRSPRFSSFDSQASLAEYANVVDCGAIGGFGMGCEASGGEGAGEGCRQPASSSSHSGFRLFPDALTGDSECNSDNFKKFGGHGQARATAFRTFGNSDYENQYVPRSYSNYDMMQSSSSPRRRMADAVANVASKEPRPNRLFLNSNSTGVNLKLDLPLDCGAAPKDPTDGVGASNANLNFGNYPADFPPTSALPDFVQDHWMDSLYAHDLHLNSPRNSPTRDINVWASSSSNCASGNSNRVAPNLLGGDLASANNPARNDSLGNGIGLAASVGINIVPNSSTVSGASKMLPDFLSDGPIIHSSQRLADVAAGLPSNPIGSPEETSLTSQLTRLRVENERLQNELSDARKALDEQTRRASELERQLQEENRRRATPTAQQVMRLKQQLAQMAEETELLRRENDALREDGAVGGYCDNSTSGTRGRFAKPSTSRSQQISQALLRAASNAESNLRQLLAGVDNLRQMAADIENPGLRLDYDGDIDIFSDFLDDCDAYEDFSGGPAL